jgi:hypothetical protein
MSSFRSSRSEPRLQRGPRSSRESLGGANAASESRLPSLVPPKDRVKFLNEALGSPDLQSYRRTFRLALESQECRDDRWELVELGARAAFPTLSAVFPPRTAPSLLASVVEQAREAAPAPAAPVAALGSGAPVSNVATAKVMAPVASESVAAEPGVAGSSSDGLAAAELLAAAVESGSSGSARDEETADCVPVRRVIELLERDDQSTRRSLPAASPNPLTKGERARARAELDASLRTKTWKAYHNREWASAEKLLSRRIEELDGDRNATLLSSRSFTRLKLSQADAALRDAELAVALEPFSSSGHRRRAAALRRQERPLEACDALLSTMRLSGVGGTAMDTRGTAARWRLDPGVIVGPRRLRNRFEVEAAAPAHFRDLVGRINRERSFKVTASPPPVFQRTRSRHGLGAQTLPGCLGPDGHVDAAIL